MLRQRTRGGKKGWIPLMGLAISFALVAAACGDSSEPDGATGAEQPATETTSEPAAPEPPDTPATDPAETDDPVRIGVMIKDTSIAFFGRQILGYEESAELYGMDLVLLDGQGEVVSQVAAVQQLIAQGVDMIMITPSDPQGIIPAIQEANAADIPVIAVNSGVGAEAEVVTFVGADDVQYGEALGELLVEAIGTEGNIAIIRGRTGDSPDLLRREGLQKVLEENPNIQVLDEQSGDWDNAQALAVTQDFLTRFPAGELDAIVDVGPTATTGALFASNNGRTGVSFIVGDFPKDVKDGIEEGYIFGAVNQDPYEQSARAMELANFWFTGQRDLIPTPADFVVLPIVTADNVADFPPAWGG